MNTINYYLVAISVALLTTATNYSCNPPNGDFRVRADGFAKTINGTAFLSGTLYAEWDVNNEGDYDPVTITWYHRKTDALFWNEFPQNGTQADSVQADGVGSHAIGFVGGGSYNIQEAGNGWATSMLEELLEALLQSLL